MQGEGEMRDISRRNKIVRGREEKEDGRRKREGTAVERENDDKEEEA